jgi:ABC-type bacteriocin/lantibiotic exporter with double-glycine peptidase domain
VLFIVSCLHFFVSSVDVGRRLSFDGLRSRLCSLRSRLVVLASAVPLTTKALKKLVSLLSEYPEQQRQHDGSDDAGSEREIEIESVALEVDVAGQVAEAQF